jgi:hypothetical protein
VYPSLLLSSPREAGPGRACRYCQAIKEGLWPVDSKDGDPEWLVVGEGEEALEQIDTNKTNGSSGAKEF